ncbi:unnamed protein product [Linum tenue]|uniref:RNA polymerase II C-terminal domain phosphatase-like n=2 Tax=Linum tenue TaxID=586396 RepID=A0AAV0QA01_9ROSI|nr:unnamed protein product [Linum tenue]
MSLVADSPVSSSGSDDFAEFLDGHLDAGSENEDDGGAKREVASSSSSSSSSEEEFEDDDQPVSKRTKIPEAEIVQNGDGLEGSASHVIVKQNLETSSSASVSKNECAHPGSFGKLCVRCGAQVEVAGVSFGNIHKEILFGNAEVARWRDTDTKSVLCRRKLYLVLDLDHTLLNSTHLKHMVPEEDYLNNQIDSIQDCQNGSLFRLSFMNMMTKLRPYVHTFLKEASQMFEMYIYTMGDKAYALEMAKLLDPRNEYFHAKVISRNDGAQRHQKSLDMVLGDESAVLILDDTEHVWPSHRDNLILMERYHFFASSCQQFGFGCHSLSQLKSDESEPEGALAAVLSVLRRVHHLFFNQELAGQTGRRDVRQVLNTVRKDVLKGCRIVFSRVFPSKFPAESHPLWKMAVNLGATCATEVDPTVTHVVAMDPGTKKSRWALENDKFLVLPRWIDGANYLWQRLPEENFLVKSNEPKAEAKVKDSVV